MDFICHLTTCVKNTYEASWMGRAINGATLMKHFNCKFPVRGSDHRTTYSYCYCWNNYSVGHYTLSVDKIQSIANYNGLFLSARHLWDFRWKTFSLNLKCFLALQFGFNRKRIYPDLTQSIHVHFNQTEGYSDVNDSE